MAGQLPEILITAKINESVSTKNLQDGINKIGKQIIPVQIPFQFNLNDSTKIKAQVDKLVSEITKNKGNVIDYKINVDDNGNATSALIKYRNELNQVTQSIVKLKATGQKLPDGTALYEWVEGSKSLSQNIEQTIKQNDRLIQSEENLNQRIQAFKTTVNSFGDKNVSSLLDNNSLGTKYQNILSQLDSVSDNNGLNNIKNQFKELKTQTTEYINSQKILATESQKARQEEIQNLETIVKANAKRQADADAEIAKNKQISNSVSEITARWNLLQTQADKSGISLNSNQIGHLNEALNFGDVETARNALTLLRIEYQQLNATMQKGLPENAIENLNTKIINMNTGISTLENKFKSLGNSKFIPVDLDSQISNLRNQLSNINNIDKPEEKIQAYNQLVQSVQKLNNAYKTTAQETRLFNQDNNLAVDKIKFLNSIDAWATKNSKALKMVGNDLDTIKSKVNNADRATLTNLQKQFNSLTKEAEAAGKTGRSFVDEIKNDFEKVSQWLGATTIVFGTLSKVKDMISTIEDLDKAATDLQMVTGGNSQQTAQLLTQYNQLATQIGATTIEVANSAGEWLRQGKSIADTNTLIKDSMVLSKVSNIDSADATTYLTSAMKGYNVEANKAIDIVDKLNAVDLVSATSAAGLAEGMSRTANAANIAGVSMNKLLGYLAVIGETTQKDMSEVGTSLQAIFSRIGNVAAGKDIDAEGESLNNVETVLNKVGIKLRDSQSQFRNFGTVLDEVAGKWSNYSNVEQNQIATAIAGTRQRENFLVLMQNYSKATEYATTAQESNGSAMKKMEVYENSIEAATKRATAAWEGFSTSILNSDIVKFFVNLGTDAGNALTGINNQFGALPSLVATASLALSAFGRNFNLLKTLTDENGAVIGIQTIASGKRQAQEELANQLKNDVQALTEYQNGIQMAEDKTAFFNQTMGNASKSAQDYAGKIKNGEGSAEAYALSQRTASTATTGLGIASKAAAVGVNILNAALTMGIAVIASMAIQAIVTGFENLANAQQNAIDKANELTSKYQTNVDTAKSNISTLEGLQSKYNELSKGVDKYGNNVALSTDEYKEYKSIVEQVVGISPSLQTGYDKEGKAIANNNGLIEKAIELENEKIRIEKDKLVSSDNLWTKAQGSIGDYNKQLDTVNQKMSKLGTDISSNLSFSVQNSTDKYKEFLSVFNLDDSKLDKQHLYNQQGYITQLLRDTNNLKKVADVLKENPLLLSQYINVDGIEKVRNGLTEYTQSLSELDLKSKELNSTLQIVPETLASYGKLNDFQKNFLTDYINSFNITATTTQDDVDKMKQSIKDMTDSLANNSEAKNAINQLFSIDKTKLSASDYESQVNNLINEIAKILKLDANKLKITLGFDVSDKDIETMLSDLKSKVKPETESFIKGLSVDDLKIAYKVENIGSMSPSELANAINKIKDAADKASDSTDKLADSMKKIQDYASVFESVKKDASNYGTISLETLQKIVEKYPELETAVEEYQAGLISTSGLMSVLQGKYQEDVDAYKRSLVDKLSNNDSFYTQTILKNSQFVNKFRELYGVDLTNYKNLAQAKSDVDNKLLKNLIENWSKFYNAQTDTFTEDYSKLGMVLAASPKNKEALAKVQEIESQVAKYRKAKQDLEGITLNGVSFNTSSELGDYKKSEKSAESAAKKAADTLKEQYQAELKIIEANKDQGKYDKDKMSYYRALSSLQQKWAKTQLDSEDKLELQTKVYSALKDYQQNILDTSYKELQNRIDLGVVQENSKAVLQNLLEIQKNLNSAGMSLVNTEENRLALAKKIYDVQKAMREQDKSNIDSLISETESMIKQQYDIEKDAHQTKLDHIKSEYEAEKDALDNELDAIKQKIKLQEDALQKQEDAYKHNEEQAEKEKAVADLRSKIAIAKNDTSDAGIKNILDLQNQLAKAQKSLTDYQFDYSIDQQKQALQDAKTNYENQYKAKQDQLEKEEKAKEDELQKEIDAVKKAVNNEVNIRKQAMDLINSKSQTFYNDLMAYNAIYSDKTKNEIKNLWDSAYDSLSHYGTAQIDVLATLEKLTSKMSAYSAVTKATRNTGSISNDNTYTVKKGDTLSKIADWFGISLSDLVSANSNIKSVKVGQKVKIPTYATGIDKILYDQIANVDDGLGKELIIHAPSKGRLTSLEYGSTVYDASATKNILDSLAMNSQSIMASQLSTNLQSNLSFVTPNKSSETYKIEIPINIQGNADAVALNQLRKDIPDLVYKAINKANSGTSPSIWKQ
jgi:TP901 family phage tail tape measure protein